MHPYSVKLINDGVDIEELDRNMQFPMEDISDSDYWIYKNYGENNILLLSVIRLDFQKNPILLLKISNALVNLMSNVRVFIIGDGELYKECENYLKKTKARNIYLLGYKKNYLSYLLRANFVLFTSYNEGLPLVLLQAMYYKKPIITSYFRGVEELVDRRSGLIFHEQDVSINAQNIKSYIEASPQIEDRSKIIKEYYSVDRMLAKYNSLFKELV